MNAYSLFPTRAPLPRWVHATFGGLATVFALESVAVIAVLLQAPVAVASLPPTTAPVAAATHAVQPQQNSVAAAVAASSVAPKEPVVTPLLRAKAPKRTFAKRFVKRATFASRTTRRSHKPDELDKLLGLN